MVHAPATSGTTPARETARMLHAPGIEGLRLLSARYRSHRFDRHVHEGYAVGVIEAGALAFRYMGENVVAPLGAVNLCVPGEPHDGHGADDDGWAYRMFYMDADLMRRAAGEMAARDAGFPHFRAGVLHDPALAWAVRSLHQDMAGGRASRLEAESRFLMLLAGLIERHAESPPPVASARSGKSRIRRVIDLMESCPEEDLSLDRLAGTAGLSPFHFIRVFTRLTGETPHARLICARLRKAGDLIRSNVAIADAAAAAGFSDQSHLTRRFKRVYGVTPAQYRNFVQYRD